MRILKSLLLTTAATAMLIACSNEEKTPEPKDPVIVEQDVIYSADSVNMNGFVAYDSSKEGPRPIVLVVHEWWGLNDYAKMRTRELAKLGYLAMAVDMYGDRKQADNPDSAKKLAMPFYMNPQMAKTRFDAALAKVKTYSQADPAKVAAIGYCFGGAIVTTMAKLGDDLKGVVNFHGNLNLVPTDKSLLKGEILVCHGGVDPFVPQAEVDQFKKQMDSIGAKYIFRVYDSATHAFSNPNATAIGKKFDMPIAYNAAADTASWNEMKSFFDRILK
jgi:dienelactone hydrolase